MAAKGSINLVFPSGSKATATIDAAGNVAWTITKGPKGELPPGYQPGNAGAYPNAAVK